MTCSSCYKLKPYIQPKPVEIEVDKYVPIPRELYRRWSPIFGTDTTWHQAIKEYQRLLAVCHAQLEAIEEIQPTTKKDKQ